MSTRRKRCWTIQWRLTAACPHHGLQESGRFRFSPAYCIRPARYHQSLPSQESFWTSCIPTSHKQKKFSHQRALSREAPPVSNPIYALSERAAAGHAEGIGDSTRARDKSAARVAGNRHDRVSPSESILAQYSCEATSRLGVTALRCSPVRMFHRSSITACGSRCRA